MEYNRKLQEKTNVFFRKKKDIAGQNVTMKFGGCAIKIFCIFLLDFHIITPKLNVCIGGKYDYESNGNCAADR